MNIHVRLQPSLSQGFDVNLIGECDEVVQYICDKLNWMLPPQNESPAINNVVKHIPLEPSLVEPRKYLFETGVIPQIVFVDYILIMYL